MEKTFDHLLGLNARNALAILASYGITDVRVTLTGAPQKIPCREPACPITEPRCSAASDGIRSRFSAGANNDEEDDPGSGFDPLLDPSLDEGMLVEARVVAVRDDGRQLLVSRFHVGEPKPAAGDAPG